MCGARPHRPVTAGLSNDYLLHARVVSLMDMCFSVNGVLFGTISCEQVGAPLDWSQRQLQTLRKIASRASLSLMHAVSNGVDTAPGALWEARTPNRLATMQMPLNPLHKSHSAGRANCNPGAVTHRSGPRQRLRRGPPGLLHPQPRADPARVADHTNK